LQRLYRTLPYSTLYNNNNYCSGSTVLLPYSTYCTQRATTTNCCRGSTVLCCTLLYSTILYRTLPYSTRYNSALPSARPAPTVVSSQQSRVMPRIIRR
jgi:hypothetical protein